MRGGQMAGARVRGFALVELAVVALALALAAAVIAVGGRQNRLGSGLAGSMANLKRFGEVTGNYAADYEDRFWAFSWKRGDALSQYGDLNFTPDDLQASANQAVDILRRRFDESVPRFSNWVANVRTGTLVLADYLDESLPMEWTASPGHRVLLEWQHDPYAAGNTWDTRRRAFASSYELPTAFFSPDEYPTITQGSTHSSYYVPPGVELGGRRVNEVDFPSRKAHLSDTASWFFGARPAWYLEPEARVPALSVDGSAAVRRTADANAAGDPINAWRGDYFINYLPQEWEVPAMHPSGDVVSGKYRWTRRGLRGIDFDGERVE